MQSLWMDIRYAVRTMRRSPAFTLAAVLTLAIGIGATSAIFSIVNALVLKPLPYREPSRLAFVFGHDNETGERQFSLPVADYLDIRRQSRALSSAFAYSYLSANLTGGDIPERVQAYRVTGNTFDVLGVASALGRTFVDADGTPGHDRVVVLSDGLWRRRFGADPGIVGRRVVVNGVSHEIVGVMPRRFEFPVYNFKGDLWIPWTIDETSTNRTAGGSGTVLARIADGQDLRSASAELETVMRRVAADHPATNATRSARLLVMGELDDELFKPMAMILSGTVGLVLLLACANVANLLLARGVSRARELAVRAAVGASRWRIARQLLVESLLLSIIGGAMGVAAARVGLDALRASLPELILMTSPNIDELGVDNVTLLFTIGVAVLATLLFGAVPAFRSARPAGPESLKEGASAGGSRGTRRLRTALVISEVALATVLAVGSALLVRSYTRLQHVSPGFEPGGLLTMAMTLPEDRYPTPQHRRQFYDEAVQRLTSLRGVRSAGFVNVLPFSTYYRSTRVIVEGAPLPEPGREPRTDSRVATPDYFTTMRIPFRTGRGFGARDGESAPRVAIVNETFVRRFLGNGRAEGRRVRLGAVSDDVAWIEIVGTVGDVHHGDVAEAPSPELYVPLSQSVGTTMMMLAVRVDHRPEDMIASVRGRILGARAHPGDRSGAARLSREVDGTVARRFDAAARSGGRADRRLQRDRAVAGTGGRVRRRLL
jgi:putative ABC transport system permease protein